jgi:sigma-54 dependent transcriptional regulator, acetoin dehydrogenase operon transcriptional activator AcoR
LSLRLPPLRERSDLPALVKQMLQAERPDASTGPHIDAHALARLQAAHWSGNLRQLRNVLRAAACLAGDAVPITAAHLPDDFDPAPLPQNAADPADRHGDAPHAHSLHEIERDTVKRVLAETGGNVSATARRLGVSRNKIYRKRRG